jgi:hypothetical protein
MYLRKILPLVYKINKRTRMFSAYLIGGKRDDSSAVRVRYSSGTSEGNVMTREPLAARRSNSGFAATVQNAQPRLPSALHYDSSLYR